MGKHLGVWQGVTFKETLKKTSDGTRRKGRYSGGPKARGWEQRTVPCGCSRTKQAEEAAGEVVRDTCSGSRAGCECLSGQGAGSELLWDSGQVQAWAVSGTTG